jgi:hypothetical protein
VRLAGIQKAYVDLVRTAGPPDRLDDHDLALLFDGAYREAFYMHDPATVRDAEKFLNAMQKRGTATDEQYRLMHETFMGARMFDEARELAKQHPVPGLEAVPDLRSSVLVPGQPTELAVDPTARVLLRESVDMQLEQVVIVSHPRCHFSANAMQYIAADPVLRVALDHARWLAPQHDHLELDAIQQWNREHPEMQHVIAYRNDEWPMIDSWGTPTFYFIKNGTVVAKVEGWNGDKTKADLLAGFRSIGVNP